MDKGKFSLLFISIISLCLITNFLVGCSENPPTIVNVDPLIASNLGGAEIIIEGTGFKAKPPPIVTIGGNTATEVIFVTKKKLRVIVPKGTMGPADIVIQNAKTKLKSLPFKGFSYYKNVTVVSTIPDFKKISPEGIKPPNRIKVNFNQDVEPASVNIKITSDVGDEVNRIIYNEDGARIKDSNIFSCHGTITHGAPGTTMFVFTPTKPFKVGNYTLKVSNAKSATFGNIMASDYIISFKVKGKIRKQNIISKSDKVSHDYVGGRLTPSDNGYAWKRANKDERMLLCKSFEQSIGGFSATWYYRALNSFYDTSDSGVLNMTMSQAASLMYAAGM